MNKYEAVIKTLHAFQNREKIAAIEEMRPIVYPQGLKQVKEWIEARWESPGDEFRQDLLAIYKFGEDQAAVAQLRRRLWGIRFPRRGDAGGTS